MQIVNEKAPRAKILTWSVYELFIIKLLSTWGIQVSLVWGIVVD